MYAERSRTREGYESWLREWVLSLADRRAYLDKLGAEAERLRIRGRKESVPVNYADE
jgi:glutaconate CoA-transferase subunit A